MFAGGGEEDIFNAMKLCSVITLGLCGVVLLAAGVFFPLVFPRIMASQLDGKLLLSADSPTIGNFISPPVPIYMQYYFFNVTNPKEILQGATAKLNQMGPFTYEEKRLKYDLWWEEADNAVTFKQNKTFYFRPDMSNGFDENTMITVLNPVLIALAAKISNSNGLPDATHGLLELIRIRFDLKPFITKKAGELLFRGYKENVFSFLAPITNDPLHATGKFGFFYPKNNTNDGAYKVHTGAGGLENLQVIQEWKGSPKLDFWKTESCNMINGTEGSQFPRPISPQREMRMYSSDLCRSLYFKYEKTVVHGGLELNRYVLPYEVLAKTPENDCYCTDDFTCKDSMVNLSPCKKGSPIVASTPHFYMGSSETIDAVQGLNPSKEDHETFLDIEPNTGVTFQAHKRIQISLPLKRYNTMSDLSKVKEVVFPVLWLNESAVVPVERARALYTKLTVPVLVVRYLCWSLIGLGSIMIILAVAFAVRNCIGTSTKSKKTVNGLKQPTKASNKDAVNEYDRTEAYKHLFN